MALDLRRPVAPPPAPKTARSAASEKRAQDEAAKRIQARAEGINFFGQIACIPLMFAGQVRDAAAVGRHWPNVSSEAGKLAESNALIARVADYMCAVGPFAGIITAAMPLVLQVMVNHNRLPMTPALMQFGVVDGETLEAQAKAEAARQQAEMMQAMRAEREAAEKAMREAQDAMGRDAA